MREQAILADADAQRRVEERRKLRELEEQEQKISESEKSEDEQKRLMEERKRIKQESEEKRKRIERERLESKERERNERMKREKEERDRQDREHREREEERKQQKEIENQVERERQRREEESRRAKEEADRLANSEAEKERQRQKELLLARMREIDNIKNDEPLSPTSRNKSYTFTRPVENLHQGKRSHDEPPSSRRSSKPVSNFLDDIGSSYQPTLNTTPNSTKRNNNLMTDLFGNSDSGKKQKDTNSNDVFGTRDTNNVNNSGGSRRQSLQAKDNPLSSDRAPTPPLGNPNHIFPRRPRLPLATYQPRPVVNAIDDIDDDLEEMTL